METPVSMRRVTRSQTLVSASSTNINNIPISRRVEDSDNITSLSKSQPRNRKTQDLSASVSATKTQDRSALIDITNDSPIVGLASGNMKTPISSVTKERTNRPKMMMMTPGSGEALLRGQVKTLLQKVEEEAELSKISLESRHCYRLQKVGNSPIGLLAPTPANTPQVSNLSNEGSLNGTVVSDPIAEELLISQVINDLFDGGKKQENDNQIITRSLLLDFSEKSDSTDEALSDCSSVLTQQGMNSKERKKTVSLEDDDENESDSIWSIQVNASSTHDEDEEEEDPNLIVEEKEDYENEEEEEDGDDGGLLMEELCKGLSKISVNEEGKAVEFAGKHTRFMYDSEDELIEEVSDESKGVPSPNVLRLKGLPTPKGKHLRFPLEDDEEEEEQMDG